MTRKNENLSYRKISQKLTNHAKNSLAKAAWISGRTGAKKISPFHLFFAIFLEKGCLGSNIMKEMGLKKENFEKVLGFPLEEPAVKNSASKSSISPDDLLKKALTKSYSIAKSFNYPYVGTEHLVYALVSLDDDFINQLITETKAKDMEKSLQSIFDPNQFANIPKIFELPKITIAKKPASKSSATPFTDNFCIDINKEVRENDEIVIGREAEIARMINILCRKNKNNPLLLGDPGVGKTALVSGLARLINSGEVPPSLYRKRIMNLDVAQLIAGTSFRGEFESRLKEIIKEASESKNVVIFIDEIHNIVGAGNISGSLDLANIIKPALARGDLQLIGATTFEEYKRHIEKDAALERRFQTIHVNEPSPAEAREILLGIKANYEKFHNVSISDEAISQAVELSARYIPKRFLPDKAIDVIDEAASDIRSKNKVSDFIRRIRTLEDEKLALLEEKEKMVIEEDYEKAIGLRIREKQLDEDIKKLQDSQTETEREHPVSITPSDIAKTVSRISKVPFEKISRSQEGKLKNISRVLRQKIIGQKEAIEKISRTLLRSQSGISNPDRPLGSFLFLGPTGVGKTLTAKILAGNFFGSPDNLIRIDMSELMERHSVSSLIGSPAGYVGYGEGGRLTEKIRRNPYSIVLFDEIEKAHPDISNILLQILEDGVLTDAEGVRADFRNAIIIMTSNIGTDEFTNAARMGFESGSPSGKRETDSFDSIKENALKELRRIMRPELINRLDSVLVFNSLKEPEIRKITELEIDNLKKRLSGQSITLSLEKAVIDLIAEKSLSFKEGARLVRKNVQEMLEDPIAKAIISNKIRNGKLSIKADGKKIKIAR